MKRILKKLEINGRTYAYVVNELGGEPRYFVQILKESQWEDYCTANGYGYKSMQAAAYAFDNRLFFAEHYEVNDDEPCIFVSPDYVLKSDKLRHYGGETEQSA